MSGSSHFRTKQTFGNLQLAKVCACVSAKPGQATIQTFGNLRTEIYLRNLREINKVMLK